MKKIVIGIMLSWPYMTSIASNYGANQGSIVIDGQVINGNTIVNNSSSGQVQDSGKTITEKRKLEAFTQLVVRIPAEVKIVPAKHYALTISGDEKILKIISNKVKQQQLVIEAKENYSTQTDVSLLIEVPSLEKVSQLAGGDLSFKAIRQAALEIIMVGDGELLAEGEVSGLTVNVTGSAELNASNLLAKNAHVTIEGMGNAKVNVSDRLDVNITGMGEVLYSGKPKAIHKEIIGMGSVEAQ